MDKVPTLVKVTMLKGEKGEKGDSGGTWGAISGTISNQTDLVNLINTNVQSEATARENAIASEISTRENADTSLSNRISSEVTARQNADTSLSNQISALQGAVGSPLLASTVSAMTDTTKIYVYTGSESGYTSGNWYYYNGSAWVSGGVYNAVAVNTDTTLSVSGMPADAGAVGDLKNDAIRGYHKTITSDSATDEYSNMDTFPKNSVVIVAGGAINSIVNYPTEANSGATVLTFNGYTSDSGTVQICYFFDNQKWAKRICVSNVWSTWKYYRDIVYRTFKVRTDGTGDFSSVVNAIENTMKSGLANYYYRYIIDIGEGEFDLRSTSDKVTGGTIDQRGLFVMPYVTIRGKGKDKTKLTYYYGGSNDSIMSMVSALNMPYESLLEDLTISVKDIRYAIHSDNALSSESSSFSNALLNNNKITLKNVCLEHLGFSSGKSPSYKVPSAWGGGSWDATDREFINCDFISQEVCGFLNHDRVGITKPSNFNFKNCNFITYNSDVRAIANTGYSSCALISWGSDIKTNVYFENCIVNKFVALTVVTSYNANAIIDYSVKADNELFIIEATTNDTQLNDNFRTSGCIESICASSAGITAYTPVSKNRLHWVHGYVSSEAVKGIALNSALQNELCIIQTSGFVAIPMLTSDTFTDGAYIGYSGGAWVEDGTNPIIRVIGGNVGVLI